MAKELAGGFAPSLVTREGWSLQQKTALLDYTLKVRTKVRNLKRLNRAFLTHEVASLQRLKEFKYRLRSAFS